MARIAEDRAIPLAALTSEDDAMRALRASARKIARRQRALAVATAERNDLFVRCRELGISFARIGDAFSVSDGAPGLSDAAVLKICRNQES